MFPFVTLPFLPPISSYGIFLALAHLFGIWFLLTLVRKRGLPVAPYVDLIFVVLVTGLVGARAAYVVNHPAEFAGNALRILRLWEGGLSFHGGFFLAFPAFLAFLWWKRLPILETSDIAAPVLPFAMAIVRLGCLGTGCCYGSPTQLPWGVQLTNSSFMPAVLAHEHLHPVPLYEILALLGLGFFLFREFCLRRAPVGTLGILSIFLYAWIRLGLDFLRADLTPGFLGLNWLTFSQASALLMIVTGFGLLWWVGFYRRSNQL